MTRVFQDSGVADEAVNWFELVAYDFLSHVLEGYDPLGGPELVDDYHHLKSVVPHLLEELVGVFLTRGREASA